MFKIIFNYTFKIYKQVIFFYLIFFLISLWVVTVSYLKSQAALSALQGTDDYGKWWLCYSSSLVPLILNYNQLWKSRSIRWSKTRPHPNPVFSERQHFPVLTKHLKGLEHYYGFRVQLASN